MNLKNRPISMYAAVLIITLFGAGATLLIVDVAHDSAVPAYAEIDPYSPTADFER